MAGHLNHSQDAGLHARNISTISIVDSGELHRILSEMIDEDGNPIWKNRVECWKDKKNKKKKGVKKVSKEVQIPVDQQVDEKQGSTEANAMKPLSQIVPIPKSQITPYRVVIIVRSIILGLFFHYRITNPVESSYGLWLTSVICEIWFAISRVLDQFPKWHPINRLTFTDELSARNM